MSKNNRGAGLREIPGRGRGECPVCGRTGIKLVYEVQKGEETIKVCKNCRNKKFAEPKQEKPAEAKEVSDSAEAGEAGSEA